MNKRNASLARFTRLSLKHVFGLVALFALLFALIACRLQYFRSQHRLADNIRMELGATAFFLESENWFDWPLRLFESSEKLATCHGLTFHTDERLTTSEEATVVETCTKLKHLAQVYFYTNIISKDCFDKLTELGIQVNHWGLSDYRLERNYIFTRDNFLKIDFDKSEVGFSLDSTDGRLWANLYIFYTSGHYDSPKYHLTNLDESIPIPRQTGKVVYYRTAAKPREGIGGNFCDGFHYEPCDFRIQIVSKTENSIRLHFDFATPMIESDYDNLREGARAVIDIEVPYDSDSVWKGENLNKYSFPLVETEGSILNSVAN